jgi:hypothetical protein
VKSFVFEIQLPPLFSLSPRVLTKSNSLKHRGLQ